ncbi:MAG: hypothetical protein WC325_09335 [Candidatus Bathyarchaeia archaeon]|jgi:hypothetical protein
MGFWEHFDKKMVLSLLLVLTIVAASVLTYTYALAPQLSTTPPPSATPAPSTSTPASSYATGITVKFKVMDTSTSTLVNGSLGYVINFYPTSADPFESASMDIATTQASFDSTDNVWLAVLNAGQYKVLIYDGSTVYPIVQTVTVPVAVDSDMEANLSPYMLQVTERATPGITTVIKSYNTGTGLYDTTVTNITDPGATARWQVTYDVTSAGLLKQIAAGRVYLPTYTGLAVSSVKINGAATSVVLDADATDDSLTGQYFVMPTLAGGVTAQINVVFTRTAALANGTYTLTLYEQYVNHNTAYRFWTDETETISVYEAAP